MAVTSESLHGNAPDPHPVALLLVDVINPLDFPEADQLLRHALPAAERLAELNKRRGQPAYRSSTPTTTSATGGRICRRRSSGAKNRGAKAGR